MEINLTGPVNLLSYGYVTVNILCQLLKKGIKVNLYTIGPIEYESHHEKYVKLGLENSKQIKNPSHNLIIWHLNGLAKFKQASLKNVGFSIFEMNRLTQEECSNIREMDVLATTCDWFIKVLDRYTDKPIYKFPLGVDTEIFNPKYNTARTYKDWQINDNGDEGFKFCSIGKFEIRKSHDKIIKCFTKAFVPGCPVKLILACHNFFLSEHENNAWKDLARQNPNIEFVERVKSQHDIARLIGKCNAYLGPSRSEGWGLELHESMMMQKPVITTNYSAMTEYCTKDNSLLIEPEAEESAFDGQFFFNHGSWFHWTENNEAQFIKYMQELYQKWLNGIDITPKSDTIKEYTWENTANHILKALI